MLPLVCSVLTRPDLNDLVPDISAHDTARARDDHSNVSDDARVGDPPTLRPAAVGDLAAESHFHAELAGQAGLSYTSCDRLVESAGASLEPLRT